MRKVGAIVLNAPYLDIPIKEDFIICADGGYGLIKGAYSCNVLLGDMDSIKSVPDGVIKIVCPKVKDYTDGERAIQYAKEIGLTDVVIYGGTGGRTDHVYSNLVLLKQARELGISATIKARKEEIRFVSQGDVVSLDVSKGTTISLLPFLDSVTVSNSNGLFYPYNNLTIYRDTTLGMSNEAIEEHISFKIIEKSAFLFINK